MAFMTHTLSGDISDVIGIDFDPAHVTLELKPSSPVISDGVTKTRFAKSATTITVANDGTFLITGIPTSADGGPLYALKISVGDPASRNAPKSATVAWFELTSDDDLARVVRRTVDPVLITPAVALDIKNAVAVSGLTGEDDAVSLLVDNPVSKTSRSLDAKVAERAQGIVSDEVATQLSSNPEVIDAAAAKALAGSGLVSTASAPAIARNRVPDPQNKTSGGISSPGLMVPARITTGLPAGFSYGLQSTRAGTLSSVIATIFAGAINSSGVLPIAVTPGETISVEALGWTDQASTRARMDIFFYDAAWALVTNSAGTYSNMAANTWEPRRRSGVVVPAGAVWAAPAIAFTTLSGNTVVGAVAKMTGTILVSGTVVDPVYADGNTSGWAWEGTPHASASRQIFLPAATQTDLATIPSRVAALEGSGGSAPLTLVKTGNALAFTSKRGTTTVANQGTLNGSSNGAYSIEGDLVAGASFRPGTDEVTPIRTQMGTVGANHGYTCVRAFANPDGKTTADLGSRWTDGTREYVLLDIDTTAGNVLILGGNYTTTAGVVFSADVAPTANLTHVAGAAHTGAIVYTTAVARQLYPSIGRRKVTLFADGTEITADGTYYSKAAEVRETYEVLDYGSLYDLAKANIGTPFSNLAVDGAVRVSNTFRYRPGGLVEVETSLTELKPTTLGRCGAIQSAPPATPTRYLPGVGSVGGVNWTTGVTDLTTTTRLIRSANVTTVPTFSLDVNSTAAWAMGYLPYGRRGDESARAITRAAQSSTDPSGPVLWDMRDTGKNYPNFIESRTAGWGRVTANAFRAILTVSEANTVLASKGSAAAAWEALDTILALSHG